MYFNAINASVNWPNRYPIWASVLKWPFKSDLTVPFIALDSKAWLTQGNQTKLEHGKTYLLR